MIINCRQWFWGESPSYRLSGKPIFPSPAPWVSLRLKVSPCSMDTIFHASLVWIMGWSTHCWNVSSPGQQTEPEPSLAVQDWPQCTAAEVHNAALAASPLSQGAILLNSSQSEQPWEQILHQLLSVKWPLGRVAYPSVDICPGSPDLAETLMSVFLLQQRGTFKASD